MGRRLPAVAVVALAVSLGAGTAGAGPAAAATHVSGQDHAAAQEHGNPQAGPADSPAQAAILPGIFVPLDGTPEGVAVDAAGMVAISVRNPARVVLFPINEPLTRRTIPLGGSGAARHLSLAGPAGPLLVPEPSTGAFAEFDLPTGASAGAVPVGKGPQQAIALGAGTVVVADQRAGTLKIVQGSQVTRTIRVSRQAARQPLDLAASPDGAEFVVVGTAARTLTEYRADGTKVGKAAAGAGPTHVVAGNDGLFWVVDTASGNVLGYRLGATGPVLVATLPVGGAGSRPYGLAFDPASDTLWVTLTGTNQLLGLHLDGDQVVSHSTDTTVRQPNSVAVAPGSGSVVVTGSTPQGQVQFFGLHAG